MKGVYGMEGIYVTKMIYGMEQIYGMKGIHGMEGIYGMKGIERMVQEQKGFMKRDGGIKIWKPTCIIPMVHLHCDRVTASSLDFSSTFFQVLLSSTCSFVHSFIHSSFHSFIHPFIHSSLHPFIPSSFHSFILLLKIFF